MRHEPGPKAPIKVWVLEDGADLRVELQALIEEEDDLVCPHAFATGEDLLAFLNDNLAPDVILADLGLPGMSGIEVIERVHRVAPMTECVVLTIHQDNDHIFAALCAGACGYLPKTADAEEIRAALRGVHAGGAVLTQQIARRVLNIFTQRHSPQWDYKLTAREKEVLEELVLGKSKVEIGASLFISPHTVDKHLRSIYEKLHVNNRAGAIAIALRERLVEG